MQQSKDHQQSELCRVFEVADIGGEDPQGCARCRVSFSEIIPPDGLNDIGTVTLVNKPECLPGLHLRPIGHKVVPGYRTGRETSYLNRGDVVDPVGSLESIRTITL